MIGKFDAFAIEYLDGWLIFEALLIELLFKILYLLPHISVVSWSLRLFEALLVINI